MASANVTPTMRTAGWNIELLLKSGDVPFAGVFQPAHDAFMTFRDIVDELRLGFEMPEEKSDVWDDLAFSLAHMLNIAEYNYPTPKFVYGEGLDQSVPALPDQEPHPEDRPILQYHVFRHRQCSLPADQPEACHFKAGCAMHISKPTRRFDPRYLPPKKASSNPRYAAYPLRKTVRAKRGSNSPKKRTWSGSVSPRKDVDMDQDLINTDEDPLNMVAPLECDISEATAKTTMASFRQNCLTLASRCAVTGMGGSWCAHPGIGPALQACHIVPQQQYHTYPDLEAAGQQDGIETASASRLEEAWKHTWAAENGILLFSHLHELFDMRLFSIHPTTLKVRVFMPYDILLQYHGRIARIPRNVSRAALRHHYEMCCMENIAAKMPFVEQLTWAGSVASTSGINTPLDVRTKLPKIADPSLLESPSQPQDPGGQDAQSTGSDPTKRMTQAKRSTVPGLTGDCSGSLSESFSSTTDSPDTWMHDSGLSLDIEWSHQRKRKWAHLQDSHITPHNSMTFLAGVNKKLTKIARQS
ncbi:hypothetical protein AK830_g12289 [Neonectria ditissima]|uniref:HNH nuclease domain-containing protein n=1 Tax=Neonectria ditissima TaxID=78410 RepID=A0A0P7AKF8_9HYPO|nr:hypothetical protein AK830_g12289 [Neonectria ditissima]